MHLTAVHEHVLLGQVPAARAREDHGDLVVQLVVLAAVRVIEGDGAGDRVAHVLLALEHVMPGRTVGILEVRHPATRPGVEGVDGHLAVGRTGQLDAPIPQVVGDGCYLPVAVTDLLRLRQKIGHLAGVYPLLALGPLLQQLVDPAGELPRQLRHEGHRVGREHVRELVRNGRRELYPFRKPLRLGHIPQSSFPLALTTALCSPTQIRATLASRKPLRLRG